MFLWALEDFMFPCLSKQIFGLECPGCGLQRSVVFLLRGDFIEAFYMYPAIYSIIALLLFLLADSLFKIKYSNIITITLLVSSVVLILGHFILKLI
jgi:hypothetical protein